MLRTKVLKFDVPNPCNENWDDMTPMDKGRYCSSCKQVVIDFTQMKDDEIIDYFRRNKKFCGSFSEEQLNKNYIKEPNSLNIKLRRFIAAIVALVSLKDFSLSAKSEKFETHQISSTLQSLPELNIVDSIDYKISGRVVVKDSSLIDNIPIHIKIAYSEIDITTDANGYYELILNKDSLKQYTIISFSHPNLKQETRTIHISNFPQKLDIEMDRPPSGRIGGMPLRYGY